VRLRLATLRKTFSKYNVASSLDSRFPTDAYERLDVCEYEPKRLSFAPVQNYLYNSI